MHTFFEKTLRSDTLFEGQIFTVTLDTIALENGREARREVVHHVGGAGVLALNERKEVAMVRQFRYAAGKEMWEIPAGKIEPGEPPIETARRELREEAGLLAAHLVPYGNILPTCAYCTEVIHLFLATGLTPTPQQLDADEFLALSWVSLDELVQWVLTGKINDSKTVSALLRASLELNNGQILL